MRALEHTRALWVPRGPKVWLLPQPFRLICRGPSVVTFRATLQSTRARATSMVRVERLVAVMSMRSARGAAGAGPQVRYWLVYPMAGMVPPVSVPLPCWVDDGVGSPTPNPSERASTVPCGPLVCARPVLGGELLPPAPRRRSPDSQ